MASRTPIRNYRLSFNFYITPGVQLLVIANFAVYILEAFINYFGGVNGYNWLLKWFGLVPAGVVPLLRIWQPFTYLFLVWGRNRFLRYYFLTGVGAGLLNVIVKTVPMLWGHENSYVPTIGASGAIFGILIACAILFPDRRAYLFPIPVAIKMKWIVAIMAAFTFLGTLGLGEGSVSHLCHLGGMLIGYLYLRRDSYLFRIRNEVSDWKYERNRKKFDVYVNKHKNEPPSRPDRWVN